MKNIALLILFAVLVSCTTSCSKLFDPTFSKNAIPNAIKDLCKEEYNITNTIDVNIEGKTLGVRIHIDNLLDTNLKPNVESLDKIQKLLMIIRRVCLSTDADLDFYVITGLDNNLGIELVFYSYTTDLQKVVAGWMSRNDYFQRLIKTIQLDTFRWGNLAISKLFKDLETGNIIKVIVNNFGKGTKLSNFNTSFLKILSDLNKKSYIKWQILEQLSVQVDSQERLYYIKAKEFFTPNQEYIDKISYESGDLHEIYVLVAIVDLNTIIKDIYLSDNLPDSLKNLGDPSTWNQNKFYVKDFIFEDFLAKQIVQRIQFKLSKPTTTEEDANPTGSFIIKGDFLVDDQVDSEITLRNPNRNILSLTFTPSKNKEKNISISKELIDIVMKTIGEVCDKYKYYSVEQINILDHNGNSISSLKTSSLFHK